MMFNRRRDYQMYTPPNTTQLGEALPSKAESEVILHEDSGDCGTLSFPKKEGAAVATKKPKEPTFEPEVAKVGINSQVNGKGTIVSDIMITRIENHIKYLNGTKGFPNKEAQEEEQITFMETIGESLKLDFPLYVIVTDHLLEVIRKNQSVFADGLAFRFMAGMDKKYPLEITNKYKTYIELLTKITSYWSVRYKLNKLIDVSYVFDGLDRKAKENITQYFNTLSQV